MDSDTVRSIGIMLTGTYGVIFLTTWVASGWPLGDQVEPVFRMLIRRGWLVVPVGLVLMAASVLV